MTASGFGRKGFAGAGVGQRRTSLVVGEAPRSFVPQRPSDDNDESIEARRAAFLTQEHSHAGASAPPSAMPSAAAESALEAIRAERVAVPTDRVLRTAYLVWFFTGLAGGHRFYLRRPIGGALQAALFLGCLVAVAGFQYYQAFAGLAASWLWYLVDGIRLKRLHEDSGPR